MIRNSTIYSTTITNISKIKKPQFSIEVKGKIMGCIPSKEPTSETPLINKSPRQSSSRKRPELKRGNTLERIDSQNGSYDDLGNYKYKKWCGIRRSTCLLILYIVFYAVFILFGAIVMMVLEEDNLYNLKKEAVEFKRRFTERSGINETELEEFISDIIKFQGSGVSMLDTDLDRTEWNLGEAILFVVTTLTTIGKLLIGSELSKYIFIKVILSII